MQKYLMNHNWEVVEGTLGNPLMMNMLQGWEKCTLPHDYSMIKERDPRSPTQENEGWTQGAALFYKKEFVIESQAIGKRFWLEFEGISGVCQIWVNKKFVAKHMNTYTGVLVEVTDQIISGDNLIEVHVDSRMKPCSRWYIGSGLYRSVWLHVAENTAVLPETLHVFTEQIQEGRATLKVSAQLTQLADSVYFQLKDRTGEILAISEAAMDATTATAALSVSGITPWCPETPTLYFLEACVRKGSIEDTATVKIGIRTIEVNSQDGFMLNGKKMKLQGGCIHHDLGILGVAEYAAAELHRIRVLKGNGYNAVRGAHNPFGPAFYDACDELGILVIEEAFDEWVLGRTDFGLHITFEDRWEQDIEDMVRRDFNHPSIIMWSTGNEVEERDGSANGFEWSRKLAEKVKSLDTSRPVSAAACSLFIEYTQRPAAGDEKNAAGNQALNMAYDNFASGTDLWGDTTAPYFAPVDVAGYNYKTVRYEHDGKKFPQRVIYGSETYPRAAFESWQSTVQNNHVIGDFVWTAWDYIGEVGVGRWEITDSPRPASAAYPWLLANCSDIDLIGQKRPQSYYRDMVWNVSKGPKMFCLPPQLVGRSIARLSWGWLPVQRNYTFPEFEGMDVEVYVYADADEVELVQNGKSLGKQPCAYNEQFTAIFRIPYVAGKIEAIAYKDGTAHGKDVLHTARVAKTLELCPDRQSIKADGQDLCFITIHALDDKGIHVYGENSDIKVTVHGAGDLIALGSADPKPDRLVPYQQSHCSLFNGTAMAVIRSGKGGKGCIVEVSMNDEIKTNLKVEFNPLDAIVNSMIGETKGGVTELTLGELLDNENAAIAIKNFLGGSMESSMLAAVRGLTLKKLSAISGKSIPSSLILELQRILD